jgi:hypothetical protein
MVFLLSEATESVNGRRMLLNLFRPGRLTFPAAGFFRVFLVISSASKRVGGYPCHFDCWKGRVDQAIAVSR